MMTKSLSSVWVSMLFMTGLGPAVVDTIFVDVTLRFLSLRSGVVLASLGGSSGGVYSGSTPAGTLTLVVPPRALKYEP